MPDIVSLPCTNGVLSAFDIFWRYERVDLGAYKLIFKPDIGSPELRVQRHYFVAARRYYVLDSFCFGLRSFGTYKIKYMFWSFVDVGNAPL